MQSNRPIFIIGSLFFVFGFLTWLGSVLIPYLRITCELNNLTSYLVTFAFYISYMVMAIPAAKVLERTGYKKGMSIGLFIMAAGSALFIPAALSRSYPLFLTGFFLQGTGLAILQTACNPYITILGPLNSAARRISMMGICNGVAAMIAPLILAAVILKDADGIKNRIAHMSVLAKNETLNNLALRVIYPYSVLTIVLIFFAILIIISGLPEIDADAEDEAVASANTNKTSIFQFPHLLFGVLTLFLYVGVEVIAGDTIITYGSSLGIPLSSAKYLPTCTLGLMLIGYIIGIITIPKYISQVQALKVSSLMGLMFISLALLTKGYISVAFIALMGLSNSMVWPSIWPLAINGLGRFTKIGSSFLIVAVGGGAIIPLLYGWLADKFSPHQAYWVVVPCYLCIWFYAKAGHRFGLQLKNS